MKKPSKSAGKLHILGNNDPITTEIQDIQNRIRERAYELSQMRGYPGRELEDWLSAESQIMSVPPAEMMEKDGAFEIQFAVAGINPENLSVMATPDQILVKGDYQHEHHEDAGTIHLCDFRSATLFRSVQFPQPVDVNSIRVEFEDGILRVSANKKGAEQAEPKPAAARKAPAKKSRATRSGD